MFENRTKAGELLSQKLLKFKGIKDAFVLAIPRGGVVVGKVVSDTLGIPLGIVYAKKIPTPGQPELAAGAHITKGKKFGKTPDVKDKNAILVDDGIATGATIRAAIKYLGAKKVKKIILAAPVAPKDTVEELKPLVDKIVVLYTPDDFSSVGQFYRYFPQITDEEVVSLLK